MFGAAERYGRTAADLRQPSRTATRNDRELIRLATLAASSHNTQPWRFEITDDAITIRPDRTRRCAVVDPDDAHLYRSLGCAAENLIHAASLQQLRAAVNFDEDRDAVIVTLDPDPNLATSELAAALTTRQCTRGPFDGTSLSAAELALLRAAGTSSDITCDLRTAPADVTAVAALVSRGDRLQLHNNLFRRELITWIRFNPAVALRRRDGLAGRVNGQPPVPTPLGHLLAPVAVRAEPQAKTDVANIESSAGVAVFTTARDTKAAWVEAGRCFERFALQADVLGVRTAFVNQPVEVPELRVELERLLGIVGRAQLVVRFGRAPYAPYSLRRPVDDVIVR